MSIRRRRRGGDSNIFNSDKRQRMKRIKQEQRQKSGGKGVNTWTPLHYTAYYVILPMVLIFVIEMMGYKSLLGGFRFIIKHPWPYVVNVLMIATSFCLSLFFRKRKPVITGIVYRQFRQSHFKSDIAAYFTKSSIFTSSCPAPTAAA